ncbi:hypothetical protein D3C81_1006600 [compost metagenome]
MVGRDVVLVGGDHVARRRVVGPRQFVHVAIAGPLVAAIAGHRRQAVPVGPVHGQAARNPADIARGIRVDLVLARRAPAVHRRAELVPVARAHVVHRPEIRRHAVVQPRGAQHPGALGPGVGVEHRAVARVVDGHRARRGLPAHRDLLGDGFHRLPAALVAVLARLPGVGLVDVEVFLIHVEPGQAEGDGAVMANRDAWQERLAGADHGQSRRVQVADVAQARRAVRAVRVIGEDRPARGGAAARDDPVVRAQAAAGVAGCIDHRIELVHRHVPGPRGRSLAGARCPPLLRKARRGRGQRVGLLQLGHGQRAGVQPLGQLRLDRRIEFAAHPVGAHRVGLAFAEHRRAVHLAREIERQAVVANPHDVFGAPERRLVVQHPELGRQQRRVGLRLRHVGVHAGHEGFGHALGV